MQYTNHYNLNLPEGSDIVNPLVQDNPNYTAIDSALYANKVRVVGNATEVKSGTVHAITRSDADIDVMRFTSTGDWIAGDTMTVDGTPVTVYLPSGTAPLTGAYVINSEVIAALNGSRVTLYTGGVSTLDADDVTYDNTSSGLTATDAQAAIDELNTNIGTVAGDVSTLDNKVSANNFGASVDIGSYNSISNMFEAPADGYFRAYAYNGVNAVVRTYGNNGSTGISFNVYAPAGIESVQSVFVRKGMKCYCVGAGAGSYSFNYVPVA